MVKEIALRHDAQQLYKQLNGAATSHSVASRSKNYLATYRQRVGKKDVRAPFLASSCIWRCSVFFVLLISRSCVALCQAVIPFKMLEEGRAAPRFEAAFKAAIGKEKNEDGTPRFLWGRDFFRRQGAGLVGLRVTPPMAGSRARAPAQLKLSALHTSAVLQLKCAWREETKVVLGSNSVTYSVKRTVRRSVGNGKCVEQRAPRSKRDGASVLVNTIKEWVKYYWACEEQRWTNAAALKRRVDLRTTVQKPCPAASEGKACLSYYRAVEAAAEFVRLDALYTNPATRGSQYFASPPSFPVPRDTLAFEVKTSFDRPGGNHNWPREFGDGNVISQAAADAALEAGAVAAPQNRSDVHAAAEANAVASVLSGTASQGRPKRNRTATRRLVDSSP